MSSEDTTSRIPNEQRLLEAIETALCGGGEEQFTLHVTHPEVAAAAVDGVRAWLAGQVVVDLPEPDEIRQRLAGPEPVFLVDGWCVRASRVDEPRVTIEMGYLGGGYGFPVKQARLIAAAMLAAADAAERLSGEVRNGQ